MTKSLRYLSWIVTVPLGAVVISFAVSNREPAVLTLWPLPFELEMPVFLPVLVALVGGLVVGGAISWMTGGRHRRLARRQDSRLRAMTAELETLRAQHAEASDAETRKREAERLAASERAAQLSAQREDGGAPRRLAPLDAQ